MTYIATIGSLTNIIFKPINTKLLLLKSPVKTIIYKRVFGVGK